MSELPSKWLSWDCIRITGWITGYYKVNRADGMQHLARHPTFLTLCGDVMPVQLADQGAVRCTRCEQILNALTDPKRTGRCV